MEPARSHLGGLDLDAAWKLYAAENPTDFVAEFATAVLREAEEDPVALAIVIRAANDLATSAALAARASIAAGEQPQCCPVGRLMRAPMLRNAFAERVTRLGLTVVPALAGSLAGAMLLAAQGPPPAFAGLVGVAGS
jgi:glucosamine kinase